MKSLRLFTALAFIAALPATTASAADGAAMFKKHCSKCHSMEPGKHAIGPSLAGIFGMQAGTQDFKKYKALKGSDVVWDETNMDAWIANPKEFIGKTTTMAVKVKKADERKAIIEFMKAQ